AGAPAAPPSGRARPSARSARPPWPPWTTPPRASSRPACPRCPTRPLARPRRPRGRGPPRPARRPPRPRRPAPPPPSRAPTGASWAGRPGPAASPSPPSRPAARPPSAARRSPSPPSGWGGVPGDARVLGLGGLSLLDSGGGVFATVDQRQFGREGAALVVPVEGQRDTYRLLTGPAPRLSSLARIKLTAVVVVQSRDKLIQLDTSGAWPAGPASGAVTPGPAGA